MIDREAEFTIRNSVGGRGGEVAISVNFAASFWQRAGLSTETCIRIHDDTIQSLDTASSV